MQTSQIVEMKQTLDESAQTVPGEEVDFWFARELQKPLGDESWGNFKSGISRAAVSCESTGYDPENHFRGVTKMVRLGSGAQREIEDFK